MLLTDGDKTAAATMAAAYMSRHPNLALAETAWIDTYFNMLTLIEAGKEKRQMDGYNAGQATFKDKAPAHGPAAR